jgi:type II secretion system protein J
MRPPSNKTRAFTLVEMLIAVTIFSILLAAIHSVFYTALRLRNTAIDSLEATLPLEQGLNVIQHDLSNLIGSTNGTLIGPLQSANPTNMLPDQIGPDFYTTGGELDGMVPWGNIEKIDYLLSVPTNGYRGPGRDLIRAVTRNLLPVAPPPQPDEKHTILSGVQNVTFLYYDGTQWDPTWDTTQQTNLPRGIKVQIQMAAQPGATVRRAPVELVIPVDVMLSTNPITAL